MPTRVFTCVAVLVLTLVACSSGDATGGAVPSRALETTSSPAASTSPTAAPSSPPASDSPGSTPSSARATATPPAGAPVPPIGEYVYAQQGSEMFCSAAACGTPRPLPPTMNATVRYDGRNPTASDRHAVGIEIRFAQGRVVRVSSEYSDSAVTVGRLEASFSESGVTQSGSITPRPPITLLSFPLRAGARSDQAFADGERTGRYTHRVVGRETINAAGERSSAWKIVSKIVSSGDVDATIDLTMWVDEETRTFLRLSVSIDATYEITRYKASFTDTLQSRPR